MLLLHRVWVAKASDERGAAPGSVERGEGSTCKAPRTGGSLVGSGAAEQLVHLELRAVPVQRVQQGLGRGTLEWLGGRRTEQ